MSQNFTFQKGDSPLVITAIHDGHEVRDELKELFALNNTERLREEDPFTAVWANISENSIVVHHSRFEVDVNRPREKAVYQNPEDAWGLEVWNRKLPVEILHRSLSIYDSFFEEAKIYFDELFSKNKYLIVYDIHSYNYRREGLESEADPLENPEINLGTRNMDREFWQPVIETLTENFRLFDFDGRSLDVRENVKFKGGFFGQWLYERYGSAICPISIEFKKIFMNEHTGTGDENCISQLSAMIRTSIRPVLTALEQIGNR